MIFVTSVTMKIKVTAPKQIGFLRGLWKSYIPGFNLVAVKYFFYHEEKHVFAQTDQPTDSAIT